MMTFIKKIIKSLIPDQLKSRIVSQIERKRQQRYLVDLKSKILHYYRSMPNMSAEELEVVSYLSSNPITVFPYDFQSNYDKSAIEVIHDPATGLPYVLHDKKRLYFKRSYTDAKIKGLYHGLLLDQDIDSPHRYLTEDFSINTNDIIADIGAAEGNFSLTNVEKVKKIYLFECDSEWIEALEATFSPWKEKVVICNSFVSNSNSDNSISLDTFVKEHGDITFLKVDIEGEEGRFLEGAREFIQSRNQFKIAICTYHNQEDEELFTHLLKSYDLEVNSSRRFMIFYHDRNLRAPYLRRGLLRSEKIITS